MTIIEHINVKSWTILLQHQMFTLPVSMMKVYPRKDPYAVMMMMMMMVMMASGGTNVKSSNLLSKVTQKQNQVLPVSPRDL